MKRTPPSAGCNCSCKRMPVFLGSRPQADAVLTEQQKVIDAVRLLVRSKGRFHTEKNYAGVVAALTKLTEIERTNSK